MVRYILILVTAFLLTSCGASTKSYSNKKGLMLLDQSELPRNAKMRSPKYQKSLKKSQKSKVRENRRRYKRAGR